MEGAFSNCPDLLNVNFVAAAGLISIGATSFQSATGLTVIDLTKATSLETIGVKAFKGASGVVKLTLPSSITGIAEEAFKDTGLSTSSFVEWNGISCPDTIMASQSSGFDFECAAPVPTSAPTSAPTLVLWTVVDAYIVYDTAVGNMLGVEGGDTVTIVGSGFAHVNATVTIGGIKCDNARHKDRGPHDTEGYELIECSAPCFDSRNIALDVVVTGICSTTQAFCTVGDLINFNTTQPWRSNEGLVTLQLAPEYTTQSKYNYVCRSGPTITSIVCVDDNQCENDFEHAEFKIAPNAKLKITGTNFGASQPSLDQVSTLEIMFGTVSCVSSITKWSPSEIEVTMCANSGNDLQVTIQIGEKSNTDDSEVEPILFPILFSVVLSSTAPNSVSADMRLGPDNVTSNAFISWTPPGDTTLALGYVVAYTTRDWEGTPNYIYRRIGSGSDECPQYSSCNCTVLGIDLGMILRVIVGVATTSDAECPSDPTSSAVCNPTAETDPADWRPQQAARSQEATSQAAYIPATPRVSTTTFIGISYGETLFVDVLIHFECPDFRGGSPLFADIGYSSQPFNAAGTIYGGSVRLTAESMHVVGVMQRFPIGVAAEVAVNVNTKRYVGLAGSSVTLTSAISQPIPIFVSKPTSVSTYRVQFSTSQRNSESFAVQLMWDLGAVDQGSAPVTSHRIFVRTVVDTAASSEDSIYYNSLCGKVLYNVRTVNANAPLTLIHTYTLTCISLSPPSLSLSLFLSLSTHAANGRRDVHPR